MPADPDDRAAKPIDDYAEELRDLSIEAPGSQPVGVLPWPLMWRHRIRRRAERSDRYAWIVTAVVLFGLFTVAFSITILAVSIPTIANDLGSNTSTLTWVITGPILAVGITGTTAGKLGDIHGHRQVYLIGMVGAAVFAGFAALAWNAASLIVFRILGATIGAATGPTSMALINLLFPPERRARALGYWSLVMAGGPVIGLVAGGPMVEAWGWRVLFVAQVPLTLASFVVALALLPNTRRDGAARFDIKGQVTLAVALFALMFSVNQGPVLGWSNPLVVAGFVLAPVFLTALAFIELRVEHPLVPLEYLTRRNFAFPVSAQFFTNFAYMGGFILTPLLLQEVKGYSETTTAVLMIPRPLVFAVAGPVAGYVATRVGERASAVFGAVCVVLSMVIFAAISTDPSDLWVVIALGLSGLGLGAASPALASTIANAVSNKDLGVAGAAQQLVAQVGVSLGISLLVTIQVAREPADGSASAYADAYLVGAVVAAVGVVLSAFVRSLKDLPQDASGAPRGAPRSETD